MKIMKFYNIEFTQVFVDKVNEISDYIYRFYFNKESSLKVYNNIYKEVFWLRILPHRYPVFNKIYRVLNISKKYKVIFKIDEENEKVVILRIYSRFENLEEKYFFEDF